MIATSGPDLVGWHSPELGRPENEGVIEESTALHICKQSSRWTVQNRDVALVVCFESLMSIPVQQAIHSASTRTAVELDKAHATLEQPAGQQCISRVRGFQWIR